MTYEDYTREYEKYVKALLSYEPGQVGTAFYASKLADLEEAHPEHAARYDQENN